MRIIETKSAEETKAVARKIAKDLDLGAVVLLEGELGSGKTTFIQGLAEGLDVSQDYYVSSPTFALINEYRGNVILYHVDLYRIEPEEVEELGLDELLAQGIIAIEWAERLPFPFYKGLHIRIEILDQDRRRLLIEDLEEKDRDI